MTVKDLIEKLQQFDPSLPVVIRGTWPSVGGAVDVNEVQRAEVFTDGSGFYGGTRQAEAALPATVVRIG
ncbi:MAG TPA: hypothetical protein VKD72_23200 [Gemmataceae bacterium]|nr:hypothetical protein [Gemmataceae bacterium]